MLSEQQTENERHRLTALVNSCPVGILMVDSSERVLVANREAERIMGFSWQEGDRLGDYRQVLEYLRPDGQAYLPHELPLYRALYFGQTVRAQEVWVRTEDRPVIATLVRAIPMYSPDGEIEGAVAVIEDITPLEEMEKLRNDFLSMVSQGLKTPIMAIKGAAMTILERESLAPDREARELFTIIRGQLDQLQDLADRILDITSIEAGTFSVRSEPIDLVEVLQEARAEFLHGGGTQEVQVPLPEAVAKVNGDRRRIYQVLVNLLSNAARFSPPTSPIIVEVQHDRWQVTVHVHDRGRGFPRDKRPYLFRKSFQFQESGGRQAPGIGLALSICKGIIEAHGGRIWADSPGEGEGATFSFSLPIAIEAEAQGDLLSETAVDPSQSRRVRRGQERARILMVEDDPQMLRYLQRLLEEAGYQLIVTSDASATTRLVELEEPDLVLMDLRPLSTTGFDLVRRIREFSEVPIIFLATLDQSEDIARGLRMGADDSIIKPIFPPELLARIEVALRRRLVPEQGAIREPVVLGDLTIRFTERQASVGGEVVPLSSTEYKLVYELAAHAGRILTYEQILQRVWGSDYAGDVQLLRTFVGQLRKKLRDNARHPRYIVTERGVGYRMLRPER